MARKWQLEMWEAIGEVLGDRPAQSGEPPKRTRKPAAEVSAAAVPRRTAVKA